MKYTQTHNTGSAYCKLNKRDRIKETFLMKVSMQCLLKTKQTNSGLNPGTHASKGETIYYTKMHPQYISAEWTTGCNLGKLGGMLPSPCDQLRFIALLDFENYYHNTSVPIMPPRILPLTHDIHICCTCKKKEITNNILFANQTIGFAIKVSISTHACT